MGDTSAIFRDLMLVFAVAVLYCLMLLLGRRLKRPHGVRISDWTYHAFALCFSIYFARQAPDGNVAANTKASVVEATRIEYANTFTRRLRAFFEL